MNIRTNSHALRSGPKPAAPGSPPRLARAHDAASDVAAGAVRDASRFLTAQGFETTEVGNLTAYLHGLTPVEGGWTVDEIERLLFVRHLVERQIIRS